MRAACLRRGIMTLALLAANASFVPACHAGGPSGPAAVMSEALAKVNAADADVEVQVKDRQSQADYTRWQRQFNRESFEWHLLSTKIIFALVVSIVLFGMYLTYVQFQRDRRPLRRKVGATPGKGATAAESDATVEQVAPPIAGSASTIKISSTGVEITSQIVGLLILTFSLAFFYMYISNVYPMQRAAGVAPTSAADKSSAAKP